MGSACCVARKDTTVTSRTRGETLRRNAGYSPSWSFRWDNRRRVAGELENISETSLGISTNSSMEIKGELISDRGNFSGQGSPLGNFGTPTSQKSTPMSQKSPVHEGQGTNTVTSSDITLAGNGDAKVQSSTISSGTLDSSAPHLSLAVPSSSSFCTPVSDPLLSQTPSLPTKSTQLRRGQPSPGHHLLRQISDSRIMGLKSPNSTLISEGRSSFVLSTCSNDMTVGSQGGSSDGWSMRTFSELVASSQRERWSFDSEFLGSAIGKSESSSALSYSPLSDMQNCGICSKLLTDRSSWSSQKIVVTEMSVVAVLVCGHVYHAECLEAMTQEIDRYDPSCPICTLGEKQMSKVAKKVLKAEAELKSRSSKVSRNRVVDSPLGFDVLDRRKPSGEDENFSKMEPSPSGRRSLAKPFLRRHFSLGSKWGRSLSENKSGKKGFWARYRRD
ncbi:uncharacterized protein LOC131333161 [Rhododendron vialii]|uniref:uncharacterized protein LOC131333161 n=1 Tax=Rhododendron vialii TaxID=182163 RepID=UPI0026605BB3|nr:uncharacterized protein LOC131333161 [Rhododendron vialii]XP_058223509.1 uncharacterized protein LOC131333161 [Rhododendron vialii]XP_058223510.1 uncharacterized protein LOC131333161 [Rhododendron vialii]XP_058223511.1 uncharacterized protein LOC131333161 [Rhododendron vialii]XP_058223512.1 uncharacterized protein LOC131333161 [Rhododendron vialii]XP_058223513.1 uncharacterized protein LOC131333161 [Rhododendron vialii]XP_058223514.1 uncharacterized protein LOC131333161 [Rhododendron viali